MILDWEERFENDYIQVLRESPEVTPTYLAARLGVSESSATYWLAELAKAGRVRILAVELVGGSLMKRFAVAALVTVFTIGLTFGWALAGGDLPKGKASFDQLCSSCHGAAGKGDGVAAGAFNPKPRDLSDKGYMTGLKDDYLKKVIKDGGKAVGKSSLMPAMGAALKDGDIENVVTFVRSLTR